MEDDDKPLAPGGFDRVDVGLRNRPGQIDVGDFRAQCGVQILDLYSHGAPHKALLSGSLQLNAARLDRCLPFLDLGGEKLREIFRRAAFRRNHIAPDLFETLLDGRHVERRHRGAVELLDDRGRRAGGQKECIPARDVEVGQPLLIRGRQIRQT